MISYWQSRSFSCFPLDMRVKFSSSKVLGGLSVVAELLGVKLVKTFETHLFMKWRNLIVNLLSSCSGGCSRLIQT